MAEVHPGVTAALVGLRFIHVLAAALWVGGGLLFLYVIAPLAGPCDRVDLSARLGQLMAKTVGVFLLSGVILIFARLPEPNLTGLYIGLLAFKLALAGVAFFLVWRGGAALPQRLRRQLSIAPPPLRGRVGLAAWSGAAAYLVSLVLQLLIEQG